MEILILIILLILAFGLYMIWKKLEGPEDSQSMQLLQGQMQELTRVVDVKINHVQGELIRIHETNKQVMNFTEQLRSLQDILKNPKQRGILGEYYLETILKNVMPPGSYAMQYVLGKEELTGKDLIVDAVVFANEKIIPIDSKFSLENYNRLIEEKDPLERDRLEKVLRNDLKNRIDETSKYVQPSKNTTDFAFMFIPHEAIYYDLLINEVGAIKSNMRNMIDYAFKDRRVIIVSPTSFLAYLETVLQGLNALQFEKSAKEIAKNVGELKKHLSSYEIYLKKLGNNLGTTVNIYNTAYKEYAKIDKDVTRVTGKKGKMETVSIDLPISHDE